MVIFFLLVRDAKRVLEHSGKVSTFFAAPNFDSVWTKKLYTTAYVA